MALRSLSVQLYSVRDTLETDPAGAVRRIADIGLRQVETGVKFLDAAPGLLEAIHEDALGTPTMTSPLFERTDRARIWELAKQLGAGAVIDTYLSEEHWTSLEDVAHIADELNAASREAAEHGLRVGYHNHWWELEIRFDGRTAFDHLIDRLDPAVVLEVDAYWVAVGGADPVEFVGRHADRVRFLHLKDGPISRDNAEQVPAGQGRMPLLEVIEAATELEAGAIEFDAYAGDVFAAIAESVAYLGPKVVTA